MEYKRIVAKSMAEAKQKMIQELGDEAYIIDTNRIVKKKMFGLKKESFVEIKAGKSNLASPYRSLKDDKPAIKSAHPSIQNSLNTAHVDNANPTFINEAYLNTRNEKLRKLQNTIATKSKMSIEHERQSHTISDTSQSLYLQPDSTYNSPYDKASTSAAEDDSNQTPIISTKTDSVYNQNEVYQFLMSLDFSHTFAIYISHKFPHKSISTPQEKKMLADFISKQYIYAGKVQVFVDTPNTVFFVGSTGEGKTTTLVKVMTNLVFEENREVVAAAFDVKKLLATTQLEGYVDVISNARKVLFRQLRSKKDYSTMMKECLTKQIILVDTSGISYRDKSSLEELSHFVTYLRYPREVHLCLSANVSYRNAINVARAFKKMEYDRLLITKYDESYSLGAVLSVAYEMDVDLSYLSTGQEVPHNIEVLTADSLAEYLYQNFIKEM